MKAALETKRERSGRNYLTINLLQTHTQAACGVCDILAALDRLKYWSSVVEATSRMMLQSEQWFRCCSTSRSTASDSFPSKYQQIKWIVSLQLMEPFPQNRKQAILLMLLRASD